MAQTINVLGKTLDLTSITGQTIERSHVFDVHLGETVVPYATLKPLKAILPLKRGDSELPTSKRSPGSIRIGALERNMRERWRTVSQMWEDNKALKNKLSLLAQLDYYGKLSSQLEWQRHRSARPIRIVYTSSGEPTAALLNDDNALVENVLYWIACRNIQEAHYLLAIINSATLHESVKPLMPKGQFGPRHLHKHLWKLPIPEFDAGNILHVTVSDAGRMAAEGVACELERVREEHGDDVGMHVARSELRKWLRSSKTGKRVEAVVGKLLE